MASLFNSCARIITPNFKQTAKILLYYGSNTVQRRSLSVQEHISYKLLNDAGIATPRFGVATTPEEAAEIARDLDTNNLVVKAQVLAGGRGVGTFKNGFKGGVRVCSSPEEVEKISKKMLGQILVTKQTGEGGRICNKVMVAERKFPRREFYFSIMMERAFNGPVIIASAQGGVDIEEVAAVNPDAIIYQPIDINCGLQSEDAMKVIEKVGLTKIADEMTEMLQKMYTLFIERDALLIEINPYAEDAMAECEFFALDAKFLFDDNAAFRQKKLFQYRDWSQEDPKEVEAAKVNVSYIALSGNIGCMVNGAGLAMSTMDLIFIHGGQPANFLDVGGTSTKNTIIQSFKIICSDVNVECILVNIFGGIVLCDVIAEGIIESVKSLKLKLPIVVRLQGTNVDIARKIINNSGLKIIPIDDFDEAATLVVQMSQIVRIARAANLDVAIAKMPAKDGSDAPKDYKDPCARAKEQQAKCEK